LVAVASRSVSSTWWKGLSMLPLKKRNAIRKKIRRQQAERQKDALRSRVDKAIRRLREFWELGSKILQDRKDLQDSGANVGYGAQVVSSAAVREKTNEDYVRKAMLAADENIGFSEEELEEVERLCKKNQAILGVGHLTRLLGVPKENGARDKVLQQVVEEHWSYRTLNDNIRGQYRQGGHEGGRRQRPPRDRQDLLAQLDRLCLTWRRWCLGVASRKVRPGQTLRASLEDLSDELRGRVEGVTRAMKRLQKAVAKDQKIKTKGKQQGRRR
jgi:hypothetical protein